MKKTLTLLLTIVFISTISALAMAQVAFTKRSINYIRTGPGIYYKLTDKIVRNQKVTILEEKRNWVKVKYNESDNGWLSKNSLSMTPVKSSYTDRFLNVSASTKVSRVGMSAAVKAFGKKIGHVSDKQIDPVLNRIDSDFSESEYRRFKYPLEAYLERNRANEFYQMELKLQPKSDIMEQTAMGAAIAAKIIQYYGLVDDYSLNKYINLISFALIEDTKFYDIPFYVFVLDSKELNAFACPGGFICITKGLVEACSDEAELAAVVSHEMGHILAGHGAIETEKRKPQIRAGSVFDELDEETGGMSEDEAEMEDMIVEMYDRIVSKRLLKYEFEADNIAAVMLANTGYDSEAIVRMIQTVNLKQDEKPAKDGFDSEFFTPNEMHLRLNQVSYFVKSNYSNLPAGLRLKARFMEEVR